MKTDDLVDAIGEVSDSHVENSKKLKPRRGWAPRRKWPVRVLAAALALAVGLGGFAAWRHFRGVPGDNIHVPAAVKRLAKPTYPQRVQYTERNYDAWCEEQAELSLTSEETDALRAYLDAAVPAFLAGRDGENAICSPMNIFVGLAMLTETAGGNTRQQMLELLGLESAGEVRALTKRVWNALYVNDGVSTLELANSIWLNQDVSFNEDILKTLEEDYYASAFSGRMGSNELNGVLRDWLNSHTDGLLKDMTDGVSLEPDTVMALVSAIYFKDKWYFDPDLTEKGLFHSPGVDVEADFMHQTMRDSAYYWGDNYGAVIKNMQGSRMVLILPDEGVTPEELLSDPQALELLNGRIDRERSGYYDIELTLPRFDVQNRLSLMGALRSLGVTDAMDAGLADFSPLGADTEEPLVLREAIHAVRVKVDEEGCEGAAYTIFGMPGSAAPPQTLETVVITFDRPFLFAVLKDGLPIFTGIVNNP